MEEPHHASNFSRNLFLLDLNLAGKGICRKNCTRTLIVPETSHEKLFGNGDVGIAGRSVLEAALAGVVRESPTKTVIVKRELTFMSPSSACRYVNVCRS
ncbi:hypothetical protein L6452_38468 [Arctium lappa]|uniref:Uncharacterized protein n=1 Tax=Arctium lappa TaxID=4217 RepID=A0ACB8XP34_ARCLA|nr:hypothetical protein L6452_38468 [Arctium lappa]